MKTFQNWSGDVKSSPKEWLFPAEEAEIIQIVHSAREKGNKIRVIGSGHSFTALVHSDSILVSLDRFSGVVSVDKEKLQATVKAGTKIHELGKLLWAEGMALENQGDIDQQSVAGALSTGTHGSGITFGSLATQIRGIRMITASGEPLECSETLNADIFKAAQVSMGMLGIITHFTLQLVPAYKLHYHASKTTVNECMSQLTTLKQNNRNFEFYYFPYTEIAQVKIMNETQEAPQPYGLANYLSDMVLENGLFQIMSTISKYVPGTTTGISKLAGLGASSASRKCWSHNAYPTARLVRFHEMEYNIPAENFEEVFREVKKCIEKNRFRVHFPLECRFVKSDDIWLSPAYQRESAYIAAHAYQGMPYKEYFGALEQIYHRYGGRPHWGKLHTCKSEYLSQNYPMWESFLKIRRRLDSGNIFLNGYLESLFL